MNSKEDLIGTIWKCPVCKESIKITKKGIYHSCDNYMSIITLQQLFEHKQYQLQYGRS
jgi:hypothetical protein